MPSLYCQSMFINPLCAKLSGELWSGNVQFVCAFHFTQSFSVYRATDLSLETENS